MLKLTSCCSKRWFQERTDGQKGWLLFVAGILLFYILLWLFKITLLYVIPSLFIIKAGLYWWSEPSQRKIRPVLRKILVIMLIIWIILIGIEFYLRILYFLGQI